MERIRIYRAALAMTNFTIGELAAHCGANVNTIRSLVTNRDRDLFEVVGRQAPSGRGRPAQRFQIRNRGTVQTLLRDQQRALGTDEIVIDHAAEPLQLPTVRESVLAPADDLLLTLGWAESQILRAADYEGDEARALVTIAQQAADEVLAAPAAVLGADVVARARLLQAFGTLYLSRQGDEQEEGVEINVRGERHAGRIRLCDDIASVAAPALSDETLRATRLLAIRSNTPVRRDLDDRTPVRISMDVNEDSDRAANLAFLVHSTQLLIRRLATERGDSMERSTWGKLKRLDALSHSRSLAAFVDGSTVRPVAEDSAKEAWRTINAYMQQFSAPTRLWSADFANPAPARGLVRVEEMPGWPALQPRGQIVIGPYSPWVGHFLRHSDHDFEHVNSLCKVVSRHIDPTNVESSARLLYCDAGFTGRYEWFTRNQAEYGSWHQHMMLLALSTIHPLRSTRNTEPPSADSPSETIRRQVMELGQRVAETLAAAAVIGNEFPLAALVDILGTSADGVLDRLEPAIRRGAISSFGLGWFTFAPLVRDVLLQSLDIEREFEVMQRVTDNLRDPIRAPAALPRCEPLVPPLVDVCLRR